MGGDDVANVIRHTALKCQSYPGERVAKGLSSLTLTALAVGTEFIFEQLADVGEDSAGDYGVDVNGESVAHEAGHGFRGIARDVDDATLVLHEGGGAVGDEQGEGDVVQIVGSQRTAFESLDPGLGHLLTQLGVADPGDFRPQPFDGLTHDAGLLTKPVSLRREARGVEGMASHRRVTASCPSPGQSPE